LQFRAGSAPSPPSLSLFFPTGWHESCYPDSISRATPLGLLARVLLPGQHFSCHHPDQSAGVFSRARGVSSSGALPCDLLSCDLSQYGEAVQAVLTWCISGVYLRGMKMLDVPQSGSQAGTTSSRNRFGQYRRTRAIPVNPQSTFQGNVRGRLAANSAAWRALTDLQRAGWASLGSQMTRTDALGQSYSLTGFQAYCSVNNNNVAASNATVSAAPSLTTPSALLTVTPTATAATFSVAYTATPLAAGQRAFIFASPQRSAGRNFEGDLRLVHVSAAAAASPANIFSAYSARFGTPVVGNKVFLSVVVYDDGFQSGPFTTSVIVTA
jgi:hypothetical protein